MKQISKRLLSLLLCLVLCISWLPAAALAEEEAEAATEETAAAPEAADTVQPVTVPDAPEEPGESVEALSVQKIDLESAVPSEDTDLLDGDTWIPDSNFRLAIQNSLGVESLTPAEAAKVEALVFGARRIHSLTGISYFPGLKTLYCDNNCLTTLDVSGCTQLEYLNCSDNELTALDISGCTALRTLDCSSNELTALDISGNTALEELRCGNNMLGSLDISSNTALEELDCSMNRLKSLDVSRCAALRILGCSYNELRALDVAGNTALEELSCSCNQLAALDITSLTALNYLDCECNALFCLALPSGDIEWLFSGDQSVLLTAYTVGNYLFADLSSALAGADGSALVFPDDSVSVTRTSSGLLAVDLRTLYDFYGHVDVAFENGNVSGYLSCMGSLESLPFGLQESYLLLAPGESASVAALLSGLPERLADIATVEYYGASTVYSASDGPVVTGSGKTITALNPGVAEVACTVLVDGLDVGTAACRVDVTGGGGADVKSVSLIDTAVTANIYSKTYPRIGILQELEMLNPADTAQNESLSGAGTLLSAEFVDAKAAAAFNLRVVDDRTLELVPTEASVAAGLKGSFNSQIRVYLMGAEEPLTTTAKLKLKVVNTLPAVKGDALSLNCLLEQQLPIILNGADVESIAVVSAPEWLAVDTASGTVSLAPGAPEKASGSLVLRCTLTDCILPVTVTVKVRVSRTEPVVKTSTASVTLTAGGTVEYAWAKVTTPGFENLDITVSRITEGSGKSMVTYPQGANCPYLLVELNDEGVMMLKLDTGLDDGANHTLKVYLTAGGKETAVTVKVKTAKNITLSATPYGTMDSTVDNSRTAVRICAKGLAGIWAPEFCWNEEWGCWEEREASWDVDENGLPTTRAFAFACATFEGFYTKNKTEYVPYTGEGLTTYSSVCSVNSADNQGILIYRAANVPLPKDTYYAKVGLWGWSSAENAFVLQQETYVKLKITFPAKPSVPKLKIKAALQDYYRDGCVALCFNELTNLEQYGGFTFRAVKTYDAVTGKQAPEDVSDWFQFLYGEIYLSEAGWSCVKPGDKYTFTMTCTDFGLNPILDASGNPVSASFSITLKGGKVKATAAPVQLLKKDRFDTATSAVSITGAAVNTDIAPILDAKSAKYYDAQWETDEEGIVTGITLRWKDGAVAPSAASGTVKVSYFVVGNNNPNKPDKLSVKLTVK